MKSFRVWVIVTAGFFAAVAGGFAYWKHFPKDGSSLDRAIVLTEHSDGEVPEEWHWITKLHPDAAMFPLEHATMSHHGRFFSYYSLTTPHGEEEIYFDTGNPDK